MPLILYVISFQILFILYFEDNFITFCNFEALMLHNIHQQTLQFAFHLNYMFKTDDIASMRIIEILVIEQWIHLAHTHVNQLHIRIDQIELRKMLKIGNTHNIVLPLQHTQRISTQLLSGQRFLGFI